MSTISILNNIDTVPEIKTLNSAWEALNLLDIYRKGISVPDLIIVDLHMPFLNGFGFIEKFEKTYRSKFPDCKIVVFSNSMDDSEKEKALKYASVSAYIRKPMSEEKFEKFIKPLLN